MTTDGKEDPKKEEGNLPPEVKKVLEDVKSKLDAMQEPPKEETPRAPTVPSYADQRADLQKRLGFNDDQMAAHEQMILKNQAPVIEQTGWNRLEKKSDLENYRKEIEQELSIYPQERRTPDIMEKIYYFVKGKHADSQPKPTPKEPGVESPRISRGPGYTGSEPSSGAPEPGERPEDEKLSETEEFVAQKLGVNARDYARAKKTGREVWQMKPPDDRQFVSSADLELKRLMNKQR